MQTVSRSSSSALTFIFSPVTDFILFMKHLYLDVLPSPKSKHEKKKKERNSWCPFSLSILLFLFFIFRQRPWVSPAQSQSFTSGGQPQVLLILTQCFFISVFRIFTVSSLSMRHTSRLILGDSKRTYLSVFFLYFHGLYESCRILSFKCLLSSKTNLIPDSNNLAAGMWLQGGTYFYI